jgi:hypothetical protein
MAECSEAAFLEDLCAFHRERGGRPAASPEAFPDAILNGSRLDLFNLYREVTSRGGFQCAASSTLRSTPRHPNPN